MFKYSSSLWKEWKLRSSVMTCYSRINDQRFSLFDSLNLKHRHWLLKDARLNKKNSPRAVWSPWTGGSTRGSADVFSVAQSPPFCEALQWSSRTPGPKPRGRLSAWRRSGPRAAVTIFKRVKLLKLLFKRYVLFLQKKFGWNSNDWNSAKGSLTFWIVRRMGVKLH